MAPLPRLSTWAVAVASPSFCLCSVVRRLRILRFRFSKARSPAAAERRRSRTGRRPFSAGAVPAVADPGRPWAWEVRRASSRSRSRLSFS